jgi:hypothetical protein
MAMTMRRAALAAVFVALLASCSGDDSGNGNQNEPDASDNDGGTAGQGGSMGDDGGIVDLLRVPATVTAFSTIGEPRTGDDLTLSGDGFEYGERLCTANGLFCVTGGFGP